MERGTPKVQESIAFVRSWGCQRAMFRISKRLVKATVAAIARRAGFAVIPQWKANEFPLAIHLRRIFREFGIDYVIDVGANRGQYRDLLRQEIGYSGPIISFEPLPELAHLLQSRAETEGDQGWEVHCTALGASESTLPLNVATGDDLSSFFLPNFDHVDLWRERRLIKQAMPVPVRRLDSIDRAAFHAARAPFVKTDTQGYDLEVLTGADGLLQSVVALQVELSVLPLYLGAPDWLSAIAQIRRLGFVVSGLYPVRLDKSQRAIEFDGIFVNPLRARNI
jgi:FkbM family methyltransferase